MREAVPELVTLHLWRVPGPRRARGAGCGWRPTGGRCARRPGVRFAKLLGTGDGRTFTARDADPRRWGLLASWADRASARAFESSATVARWAGLAEETWRVELRPLAARGRWSGQRAVRPPAPAAAGTARWRR